MEACARAHAKKLERIFPRLAFCEVTIDSPHRHKTHGREFRVRLELGVPGDVLVVSGDHGHENAYAALNAAFAHGARQLADVAQRRQRLRHCA